MSGGKTLVKGKVFQSWKRTGSVLYFREKDGIALIVGLPFPFFTCWGVGYKPQKNGEMRAKITNICAGVGARERFL